MHKRLIILFIVILSMLITGCWDNLELEKRAFVLGIALDKADNGEVTVTYQIALPQAFGAEGGESKAYWNITETAQDITSTRRQLTRSINWIPTFEHCQVLLIGEDLAREGIEPFMDFFFRSYDIRRRMDVCIVQGKAGEILNMEFDSSQAPSFFLSEMIRQNSRYTYEMADYYYIGRVHEAFIEKQDFAISRINKLNDYIDFSGAGVFKDFRLVGWLSGEEVAALRFLRGDIQAGAFGVDLPVELGKRIMLRVFDTQTSLKPEFRNNKLYAVSRIRIEGDIEELGKAVTKIDETSVIYTLERAIESYLEDMIKRTFYKTQQEFNSEPFRFKNKVMNYLPNYWQANQENWDEIYSTVQLDVEVEVRIRRIGEINY